MYVQAEMAENVHVLRGMINHEHVNEPGYQTQPSGVVAHRRVHVYSYTLGISGICDLVEESADGTLTPGRVQAGAAGQVDQRPGPALRAQALCLEEMTGKTVPRGAIFYFGSRRREEVLFTPELREQTLELISAMQRAVALGAIPPTPTTARAAAAAACTTSACRWKRSCLRGRGQRTPDGPAAAQPGPKRSEPMTTLYLTEPYSVVRKDGDTLVVNIPANAKAGTEKRSVRVPLLKVDQVVVMGDSTVTTPALLALLEQNAEVCFCDFWGRFQGRLAPEVSKNVFVRTAQFRAHEDYRQRVLLAARFVRGKLHNQRTLLLRSNRERR